MLEPGGGHERGYRPGTENLPGALGFAAALEAAGLVCWPTSYPDRYDFKDLLAARRRGRCGAGAALARIVACRMPGVGAVALLIKLDAMGFAISAGSACSSGTLKQAARSPRSGVGRRSWPRARAGQHRLEHDA